MTDKKRITDMYKTVIDIYSEKCKDNIREISNEYLTGKERYDNTILEIIKEGLDIAANKNKKINYIMFFVLQSSILTQKYDLLIALYDERMYLDRNPIELYYKPDYIVKYIENDFAEMVPKIGNVVIRPNKSELDLVKRYIAVQYYSVFAKILVLQMQHFRKNGILNELLPNKDIIICFGEYMGKTIPIYCEDNDMN